MKPSLPDVLASRYASEPMVELWSPEHKVVLERRLWVAVLEAQRALGVDVPAEVIEDYRAVVDTVDLASIEARERVTRHDVKARIEEFSALAGHEHIHKGMTSRDLTENVEQLQVRLALELVRDRMVAALARLAERAAEHAALVMAGRTHNVPAQATTLGKRFANAGEELLQAYRRVDELLARYPLRGIKGPVGTQQDKLDLLGGDAAVDQLEAAVAEHLGFGAGAHQRRPGLSPVARPRRRVGAGAGGRGPASLATTHPADGRPRAGDRGLRPGPGRLVGHAPQDEHPVVRADQRPGRRAARATWRWSPGWPATSGTRATCRCSVVRRVALPDAFFATDGLFETFLTVLDELRGLPGGDRARARAVPALPRHHQGARGRRAGGRRARAGARGDQGARGRRRAGPARGGRPTATTSLDRLAADDRLGARPGRARRACWPTRSSSSARRPPGRRLRRQVEPIVADHPEAAVRTDPRGTRSSTAAPPRVTDRPARRSAPAARPRAGSAS